MAYFQKRSFRIAGKNRLEHKTRTNPLSTPSINLSKKLKKKIGNFVWEAQER